MDAITPHDGKEEHGIDEEVEPSGTCELVVQLLGIDARDNDGEKAEQIERTSFRCKSTIGMN